MLIRQVVYSSLSSSCLQYTISGSLFVRNGVRCGFLFMVEAGTPEIYTQKAITW
jgi:hypothetical protein